MSAQSLKKVLSGRTGVHLIFGTLAVAFLVFLAFLLNDAMKGAARARAERLAYEAEMRENLKVVWTGPCPVIGLQWSDLVVSCNGREWTISGNEAVRFSYALNPGPLDCEVNGFGPRCKPRPFKPAQ